MSRRARDLAPALPAVGVIVVLFGGALAGALRTSLQPLGGPVSLQTWRELLADPAFGQALGFTVRIALLATVASAILALAIALVLRRHGGGLRALLALPVPVPHLLVAVVAVLWLAPGGLAERLLGVLPVDLVRDRAGLGIVAVYVYKETPFLVLLLLAAAGRGLVQREEMAAALGVSRAQRLRWVIWPALRGPLVVGSIVVAAFVLGAFEVPQVVGPTSPLTVAEYARQATENDLIGGEGLRAAALLVSATAAIALAALAVRLAKDVDGR